MQSCRCRDVGDLDILAPVSLQVSCDGIVGDNLAMSACEVPEKGVVEMASSVTVMRCQPAKCPKRCHGDGILGGSHAMSASWEAQKNL